MFDINKIINDTIAAAVSTHITTLQQEYANKMAEMAEKITALDTHLAEAIDRIAALENQALVVSDAVDKRITALEHAATQPLALNKEELIEHLDNQEWFWDKIRNFTDGAVESAVEQHCEEYDHDDMVMKHELPDMDDYVTKDAMRDEVSDAVHDKLDNATLSIRF